MAKKETCCTVSPHETVHPASLAVPESLESSEPKSPDKEPCSLAIVVSHNLSGNGGFPGGF